MSVPKIKTWGQALDFTMKHRWSRNRSVKTSEINSNHITNYCGRSLPLTRMGNSIWWIELMTELKEENPTWSTSTINRVVSAATTVLKYTRTAGLHNVACPEFQRFKEGECRMTYFTKEQIEAMAFAAVDIYDRQDLADAIIFSGFTGVRQGELLKLKSDDVDLALNVIHVGGKPGRETKGKNVRSIPIHEKILPIIQRRLNQPRLFGDDWRNKDALYLRFKKVREYCGIGEDFVWHSLRHSFGTFLGEVTHPRQIMALMGHKNIETSLRYVKATDDACRTALHAI